MIISFLATRPADVSSAAPHGKEKAAHILNEAQLRAANDDNNGFYKSPYAGEDIDRYRKIFRLQSLGRTDAADKLISALTDRSLMGHVLAQRYLSPNYKTSYGELDAWLSKYGDHPEAARIARLARVRLPEGRSAVKGTSYSAMPIAISGDHALAAKPYHPALKRTPEQDDAAASMISSVRASVAQYEPSVALRAFNENPATVYLDDTEKNRVKAMVASGYLYAGKTAEAERMSGAAFAASGEKAPLAGWIHGLSLWRLGRHAEAAPSFESAADSAYASGNMASGAAYWAGRAHQAAHHPRRAHQYFEKAASYKRTFYGLLAAQALGRDTDAEWDAPVLSQADEKKILATPAGMRAEKLLAAGEVMTAEGELRGLYVRGDSVRRNALLAFAYDRNLPSLAMTLGHTETVKDANDASLYPLMPWSPARGYRIDRALLHAIARQESKFNAGAENGASGATGLMQIMPATAWHITRVDTYKEAGGKALLKNPELNLDLAQQYIEELLNNPDVGQDLMSLAVAYNAGPGTLARWKAERADIDDPLLFMETLPFAETRNYVARIMANYWMYRMKFDQPNDSMQALVEGRWARYAAYDRGALKFAEAE